jgi:hypothetical protein
MCIFLGAGIGYQAVMVMVEMLFTSGVIDSGVLPQFAVDHIFPSAGSASASPSPPLPALPSAEEVASVVADTSTSSSISSSDDSIITSDSPVLEMFARVIGVNTVSWMQIAALSVASTSVITKEALYHYTLRAGEGANSDAVREVK